MLKETMTVRRFVTNSNLVKIEKWLRDQVASGFKLSCVKHGFILTKFTFIEVKTCDDVYFSFADLTNPFKYPKHSKFASYGVIDYIKSRYDGEYVKTKNSYHSWICLNKKNITDLSDVKKSLLCRKKDIAKVGILNMLLCLMLLVICLALWMFGDITLFYLPISISFLAFVAFFVNLLTHRWNCKKIYNNFLDD